jgi:hypothetical protein
MWTWRVRDIRPRIWLDETRLALLRDKTGGMDLAAIKRLLGASPTALGLAYVLTGDEETGRSAISQAVWHAEKSGWLHTRTVAACYDWCYPILSEEDRAKIRALLTREGLRRLLMNGVWRSFSHSLHVHALDVGMCALALDAGDPFAERFLGFLKERYRDAMRVFDDVLPDGEWPAGVDLKRSATGCAMSFLWAVKTATGDDVMECSPHFRSSAQYVIHCAKPNGLVYPGGDNDHPYLNDRDREMLLLIAAEFRDPYAQYLLNHCRVRTFTLSKPLAWQEALWYDPSIPERPLDDIPRSRIFRGHGLVVARSGWGWDSDDRQTPVSWVTFRCGRYLGREAHYDNNHFEIYNRGELAIDSGRYDDDWGLERCADGVARSQFFNYYRRAVAHNTILVNDSNEEMAMGVANDGGQKEMLYVDGVRNEPENYDMKEFLLAENRMSHDWVRTPGRWDTGSMLAYTGNNLFTYACGDASASYASHKLESFVRQFLYVQADLVIVFDRVVATSSAYGKTWLLHSITEPRLHGIGRFEIRNAGGRLVCVPLLPEQRNIVKVGGSGKEFTVGNNHYACGPKAAGRHKSSLNYGELPGAWRVHETPLVPSEEDYFLNVMLLTDRDSKAVADAKCEARGEDAFDVSVSLPGQRRVAVSFARGPRPAARLLIEERGRALYDGALPDSVVLEKGRI